MDMRTTPNERRIGDLIGDLGNETATLVRQEIALARAEVDEKVDRLQSAAVELGSGGAIAFAGFLGLMAAAIFGLATVMSLWLSALIVGGVVAMIGLVMVGRARDNLKKAKPTRSRAVEEAQATGRMLKEELS